MAEREVEDTWKRLDAWFGLHLPETFASLGPPASEEELRGLEAVIGTELPEEVKASYRIHDGQKLEGDTGVIFGLQLLSIEEVIKSWESWDAITREYENDEDMHSYASSSPEGAIRLRYSHPGWIPLTFDWGGNHIGVDLAPGPSGTRGQVITFGRDEDLKNVVADDWSGFLLGVADELEAGNYEISDNRSLAMKDPAFHYHDALIELRRRRSE